MDSISLLREPLRAAHEYLVGTMPDVTPEHLHLIPPGQANPLAADYLHLIQSKNQIIQTAMQNKEALADGPWAGKIGASEPMPMPPWEAADYMAWSRRVRIDMPTMMEYAKAVYAASDAYIAGLSPGDLDTTADLSKVGMGEVKLSWILSRYVVGHADNICGEASALKGFQGLNGYQE